MSGDFRLLVEQMRRKVLKKRRHVSCQRANAVMHEDASSIPWLISCMLWKPSEKLQPLAYNDCLKAFLI